MFEPYNEKQIKVNTEILNIKFASISKEITKCNVQGVFYKHDSAAVLAAGCFITFCNYYTFVF